MFLRIACFCMLLSSLAVHSSVFPLSKIECLARAEAQRQLCILRNVAVWKGKIYVIQEGPLELPGLSIASWPHSVSQFTAEEFIEAVKPETIPFQSADTVTLHSHGILQHASLPSNHVHNMGETLPVLFTRICRFFGMCEYTDPRIRGKGGLLVLWVQRHLRGSVLHSFLEMVACMSTRQMALSASHSNEVIIVKELMVGNPSTASLEVAFNETEACQSEPLCQRFNNFGAEEVIAHRLRFWRQCVGLPQHPPLRKDGPHVVLVNRRHAAGRSILTLAEVFTHFQNHAEEFAPATFDLTYMDGLSLAQQAALHDSADVLVVPHGANFGNVVFNSARSVLLHVSADEGHRQFNERMTHIFDSVLNITTLSAEPPATGGLDLIAGRVSAQDSPLQGWNKEQLFTFIITGRCPPELADPFCFDYNLLSRNFNYALPMEELVMKVVEAMHLWRLGRVE